VESDGHTENKRVQKGFVHHARHRTTRPRRDDTVIYPEAYS
jgi:hypothetical protein